MNKNFFLFLLFIIQLHASAQINIALRIESIKNRYIRYSHLEFQLFRKDSLVSSAYYPSPVFKKIQPGTYTIQFFNIYERKEVIPFNTDTLTNDSITVYIDRLDYNSIKIHSFIDLIKNDKPLIIDVYTIGCYSRSADTLVIKKEGETYVLYYNMYTKILSKNDLKIIQDFEKELRSLPEVYCTTKSGYTLSVGNKQRKFTDATCAWYGMECLKKNLDLKSYKIFNEGFW